MLIRFTFVGLVLLLLSSCKDQGCYKSQRNHILGSNQYNSKEYQAELYRLIKESPNVDYYFETREEIMGQNYLVVNAYGDAFCGKLCLVIPEVDALALKFEVDSGRGAQLIGLRYKEHKTNYGSALVYDSLEYIVE